MYQYRPRREDPMPHACGSALPTAIRQCTAATWDMSKAYTLSGSPKLHTAARELVSQTCTTADSFALT